MSGHRILFLFIFFIPFSCKVVHVDSSNIKLDYSKCFEAKVEKIIGMDKLSEIQNTRSRIVFNPMNAGLIDTSIFDFKTLALMSSLERLDRQKSFAYMFNQVPRNSTYWSTDGDLLWNNYYNKLCSLEILDAEVVENKPELKNSSAKIISECEKEYKDYSRSYLNMLEKYELSKADSDTVGINNYSIALDVIYDNWNVSGCKNRFESAVGRMEIENNKNRIIRLASAMNDINPLSSHYFISDPNHEDYYYTSYYPELNDFIWTDEFFFLPDSGCKLIEIDPASASCKLIEPKISFRYCVIHVLRPWFHPEFINVEKPGSDFSDEGGSGQRVAYIVSILLVKDLQLNYTLSASKTVFISGNDNKQKILSKNSTINCQENIARNIRIAAFICIF